MLRIPEFKSIDELVAALNLSERINGHLKANYEDDEVMEAILTGLRIVTLQDSPPSKLTISSAMADLATILKQNGYTYEPEDKREILLRTITRDALTRYYRLEPNFMTPYDSLFTSNRLTLDAYYSLAPLTKEQIRNGMAAIEELLNENCYKALCLRFGIDENGMAINPKTFEEIAIETGGRTKSSAQQIFNKAKNILRHAGNVPRFAPFTISESELGYIRRLLLEKQKELMQSPDVQSYIGIAKSIQLTGANACNETPIEELDLSVQAFNALKRAGIDTIGKILAEGDNLRTVRNLGLKGAQNIAERLCAIGIPFVI